MSGPITWKSIVGPSLADASRPLLAAQQSFNGSFDVLNNVLKQRQEAASLAQTRQEEAAKQGYLNDLFAVDNVDALAQQRQTFQERLKGLTPEQQAAVRGQFDQRVSALREQTLAANEYRNKMQLQEFSPQLDRIRAEIARGNEEGVAGDIAALPERFRAELFKSVDERGQTELKRANDATQFGWSEAEAQRKEAEHPLTLAAKRASINAAEQQILASKDAMETNRYQLEQLKLTNQQKQDEARYTAMLRGTPFEQGTLDTVEGLKTFTDWAEKNIKNETQRNDIIYNVSQLSANSKVPIAVAEVIRAVGGSGEDNPLSVFIPGWSRRGDDARSTLEALAKDPKYLAMAEAYVQIQANRAMPPGARASSEEVAPSDNPESLSESERIFEESVKAALARAEKEKVITPVPRPLRLKFEDLQPKR